ncbi:MAG: 23S rRNA (adenine(2503)-C(2))-methyltransferase RlmN, partial [Myxococcota bacterium]
MEQIELVGLPRHDFVRALRAHGLNSVQASLVWRAIYVEGARSFDGIQNLGRAAKQTLATQFKIGRPGITADSLSTDGTRKWLMRMDGDHDIETVFIPHNETGSLCVSSQVGCTLACAFCHTGTMPLLRNLKPGEIVGQLLHARDVYRDWQRPRQERRVSNIVMMGMGEPLYNYHAVRTALRVIMDGDGIALSKRRIVLSTSGIVPMIERCGNDLGVELAISLHAVDDALRDELVPINKKWPIAVLMDAVRRYPTLRNTRRILFEYVMLDDVNDSDAEARELVRLLDGIPAKVNLIPFNPWPGSHYRPSKPERIDAFATIVRDGGIGCPIR